MPAPDETISPPLSPQERDALLGISQGTTTTETACDMGMSDSTVKTYILRTGGNLGTPERAGMLVGGKTVEEIAAHSKRPLTGVLKDTRRLLRALDGSSTAHATTRGWQSRPLGSTTARENSGYVVAMAGPA